MKLSRHVGTKSQQSSILVIEMWNALRFTLPIDTIGAQTAWMKKINAFNINSATFELIQGHFSHTNESRSLDKCSGVWDRTHGLSCLAHGMT
jgi:hypothetical protein